jgi:rhodanese-related sulfurtransferase
MERFRLASVQELDDFVGRYSEFVIVDVRPEEEYRSSHIRHAVNIPYEEGKKWNLPRGKEIVVYCERGATSMAAARQMWRQGYCVISVAGGISEYRGSNLVFSS